MKYELPKSMMIDLDDTIIANEVYKRQSWNQIKKEFASPDYDIEKIVESFIKAASWFWSDPVRHKEWRQDLNKARRHILRLSLSELGIPDNGLSTSIADRFSEIRDAAMKPFPGALETLRFLNDKGVRLALVTNGSASSQREKIERFDLSGYFDFIYIEGEHEHGKPDHEVYDYTLRKLDTGYSNAWMVGDKYEWEVLAPQELGIKGVWVNSHGKVLNGNSVKPFLTLSSLSELMGIFS